MTGTCKVLLWNFLCNLIDKYLVGNLSKVIRGPSLAIPCDFEQMHHVSDTYYRNKRIRAGHIK